jgi:hypothetical protein
VRQLDLGLGTFRRGQEHERELARRVVHAPHLAQAKSIAEEFQRCVEIADADHRVQVFH